MALPRPPKSLPKRFRPYWQQAVSQAELQYGSQGDLLAGLLGDVGHDYNRSVSQAHSGARIIEHGLDTGRTQLNQNLMTSGLDAGSLPDTADARRIQQTQQGALNELSLRRQQASEGEQSLVRQASDSYRQDAGKIRDQLTRLISDRGTYTAGLVDQLIGSDRSARHDARVAAQTQRFTAEQKALDRDSRITGALVGQGIAPDGTPLPGGKADPKTQAKKNPKFKWSEPEQRNASDAIEKALVYIRKGDPGKGDKAARRAALAETLVKGLPGTTDPLTGEHSGGVPSLPAVYVSAALDLHFDKGIGRTTVKRLHGRGVKIKPLGYPTQTRPRQHGGSSSGGGGGPHGTGRP